MSKSNMVIAANGLQLALVIGSRSDSLSKQRFPPNMQRNRQYDMQFVTHPQSGIRAVPRAEHSQTPNYYRGSSQMFGSKGCGKLVQLLCSASVELKEYSITVSATCNGVCLWVYTAVSQTCLPQYCLG